MSHSETKLKIEDYDDVCAHLVRLRSEIDQVTDYMYSYESHDDTETTPQSQEVVHLSGMIDDYLGSLYHIANQL